MIINCPHTTFTDSLPENESRLHTINDTLIRLNLVILVLVKRNTETKDPGFDSRVRGHGTN